MNANSNRRGKITDENIEEARCLKQLWESSKDRRKAEGVLSQGAFGQEFDIGNQAAVGFFLNGQTALSLKAARGFAKGLKCSIGDFSPRLAALNVWPFKLVNQDMYESLEPEEQGAAQMRMMDEVRRIIDARTAVMMERNPNLGNGTNG